MYFRRTHTHRECTLEGQSVKRTLWKNTFLVSVCACRSTLHAQCTWRGLLCSLRASQACNGRSVLMTSALWVILCVSTSTLRWEGCVASNSKVHSEKTVISTLDISVLKRILQTNQILKYRLIVLYFTVSLDKQKIFPYYLAALQLFSRHYIWTVYLIQKSINKIRGNSSTGTLQ